MTVGILLTIDDLNSKYFSLKLVAKEDWNFIDSLQLQISSSEILIATAQNEMAGRNIRIAYRS